MRGLALIAALCCILTTARAEELGTVNTKFKWFGPNDKILVEVFEDEVVNGVACYLSRAKTGGITGAVGVAEDTSDASIDCRQIGPIRLTDEIRSGKVNGDEVFKKRTSLVFKTMQVVRFYDPKRNVLIYLSYSDRVIEGSPENSISVVPIQVWPGSGGQTEGGPAGQTDTQSAKEAAGEQR